MAVCKGCGVKLQTEDVNAPGYAPSLENEYCQSCFRLRHYRDFKHVKAVVNDSDTLTFIEGFSGRIFWVVDILRLSQSLHSALIRALRGKRVVMLINKRDLLPKSVSDSALKQHIMAILKDEHLDLEAIFFVSARKKASLTVLEPYLDDDIGAFVGSVNAGKSSLLNTLLGNHELSVSPVVSTTADVIEIKHERFSVYDTPGFQNETPLLDKLNDETLVALAPQKTLKPVSFQLYEKQSLVLGNGLAITFDPVKTVNITTYTPLNFKRVKPERIEANFAQADLFVVADPVYKKKMLKPQEESFDLEIFDVGFITIKGALKSLEVMADASIAYTLRKVLI